MSESRSHISNRELVEFMNTNLYIDDMIAIDVHLEGCEKCKKKYGRVKNVNHASHYLETNRKNFLLIGAVCTIIVLGIFSFSLKGSFSYEGKKEDMEDHKINQGEIVVLLKDSMAMDKPEEHKMESISSPEPLPILDSIQTESISEIPPRQQEVSKKEIPENTQENPGKQEFKPLEYDREVVIEKRNDKDSLEIESIKPSKKEQSNKKNTPIPEVVVEKKVVEASLGFRFNVKPIREKLASPINGYDRYEEYLLGNLDQLILPIDGSEKSALIISFEIQKDKSLGNFKIKSSSNQAYAESIMEVIKRGVDWTPYHDSSSPTRVMNQAEISIQVIN